MTRRLVLVRHAKATAARTDVERPLARQGEADAPAIGRWLAERGVVPDLVLVSPARRARQTWELASDHEAAVDARIYDNTVEDLLDVVHETAPDVRTLVLVGHNPSMHALALALADDGDVAARDQLEHSLPTSGVVTFDVGQEWGELDRATLVAFAAPRGSHGGV